MVSAIIITVTGLSFTAALAWSAWVLSGSIASREQGPPDVDLSPVWDALKELDRETSEIRTAVAHGIEHVERVERRIKSTVARARRELEGGEGDFTALNAELAQLQLGDGPEGPIEGLSPVHNGVAETQPSSIKGVTADQLARARGYYS